jgi:RNA:NAD 2'-phosphotransferase (TPT1/KptA family)
MSKSVQLSKKLSYILRHGAVEAGLEIRADGYVKVGDLMRTNKFRGTNVAGNPYSSLVSSISYIFIA